MSKCYVEKEALLEQVRKSRTNNTHIDSRDRHAHDTEHRHFEYMVFSAKPADVKPVVRGEWVHGEEVCNRWSGEAVAIRYYKDWHCSECGYVAAKTTIKEPTYRFCPNCGADMRGENA